MVAGPVAPDICAQAGDATVHGPVRPRWAPAAEIAVLVVAALPVVNMIRIVGRGTHLPWADYWPMMATLVDADGSTRFSGFFDFQNEHPVVVAKALYWLNLRLGDGSNIVLGYVVIAVVVVQLAVLWYLLRVSKLTFLERAGIFILSSVLLFSANGSWNMLKSMSGAAWLTANLFAFVAIAFRQRDRVWGAGASAAVATACYGTGLAAWPAVIAVGLVRRPWRTWWREFPMVALMGLGYLWYQASSNGIDTWPPSTTRLITSTITVVASPIRLEIRAFVVVAALLAIGISLVAAVRNVREAAPWVGLAAYGLVSCTFIAYGRWIFLSGEPAGRYHSLAACFWIGTTALLLITVRAVVPRLTQPVDTLRRRVAFSVFALLVTSPMIALTWMTWTDQTQQLVESAFRQDVGAAMLRVDIPSGLSYLREDERLGDKAYNLRTRGQYPFSARWDADCGLLGEVIDTSVLVTAGGGVTENHQSFRRTVQLSAEVPPLASIRCVVAIDDDGTVVGAGVFETERNRHRPSGSYRAVRIVALADIDTYRAVVMFHGDRPGLLLEEELSRELDSDQ